MTKEAKNSKKVLVTHNGSFHADDIFAAAALILYLEKKSKELSAQAQGGPASGWEIIRTRDEEVIAKGDYVFDVGGVYDEKENRFDHHQVGGAGKRNSAIEYASFGLVWKKFGKEICGSDEGREWIDLKMAAPIDAFDNGFDLVENKYPGVSPYYIQHMFFSMHPTWREENSNRDEIFLKCVAIAKEILSREIIQVQDSILAEKEVISIYQSSTDKRIIILDKNYPAQYAMQAFPEPLFIIYPRATDNYWGVKAVRVDPKTFNNRKDFPKPWGGLKNEELQSASGVEDAVFCHRGLFLAIAKSKEGAIKLAQIAVNS
jgi:uncharacterized UPF0160 family protein